MSPASITSPPAVWDRVVCGIDLTPASRRAALEAARLMPASAALMLLTVVSPEAVEGGVFLEGRMEHEAREALERAYAEVQPFHAAGLRLREGPAVRLLLDELASERATLVALGSHGHSRAAGIVLSSVATAVLHRAPCSVLIAHSDSSIDGEVLVGFDGSAGARRALAVGRELTKRLSLRLRVVVATGEAHGPGRGLSRGELDSSIEVTEDPREATDSLIDASTSARLLIVGSRHLRGISALGSVSERVAHRALCPVLVVR